MDLQEIIKDSVEELRDRVKDCPEEFEGGEPHDAIHEIADSSVPLYTSDLMELASRDIDLATNEPELGPAFDGKPTPVNIVAANIYDTITNALWEEWRELESKLEVG